MRRTVAVGMLASILLLAVSGSLLNASFNHRLAILLHAPDGWLIGVRLGSLAAIVLALFGMFSLWRGYRSL
ncbi:hypothetical protein ACFQ9V_17610 [Leifsonia sp. NPDC056665]|uniref:hypothetical protein n=1 Tax=Leifsonia sp. NPDC056665 TaxID=3345901 RepID=UPI0036858510